MPKKISAEAQVFKHFNLLSDESKRIVLDILNAWQQPAKPRQTRKGKEPVNAQRAITNPGALNNPKAAAAGEVK